MTLDLNIQTGSHTPIYRQIIDQVRRAIAAGDLPTGEQLPSVRRLAEQLVINPNTVARAYGDLIRDGVLDGHGGKGVFVAEPRAAVFSDAERRRRLNVALDALVSEALALQIDDAELLAALKAKLDQVKTGRTS
jgi:GntR family transcriptional regulator